MGSYINGVYYKKILNPFWCKALAHTECHLLNSVDWLYTRISLDGERLDLAKSKFRDFKRVLDMKTGLLHREFIWELSGGRLLKLSFLRFTSMERSNVGCQRVTFEPLNFDAVVEIQSCLDFSTIDEASGTNYWTCLHKEKTDNMVSALAQADSGGQQVFSSFKLRLAEPLAMKTVEAEKLFGVEFSLPVTKAKPVSMDKLVVNYAELKSGGRVDDVWERGSGLAEKLLAASFDELLEAQEKHWAKAWETLDIVIDGNPELQQGLRFSIFNLHQAFRGDADALSGETGAFSAGGRGLTGEADGARISWDTEIFMLPFYLFTNPMAALKLLDYRYNHLPEAIERAKEVDCSGARFPLSTIDGTESCTWWEHSMLQIHVSAAIPYAIRSYAHITKDKDFLYSRGIEILIQASRFFASRGRWSPLNGDFGLYGVMGPDELHMMVHHNFYTNVMAKKTFEYTLRVIDEMKTKDLPELSASEAEEWRIMAAKMRIPIDEKTGVYEQHSGFFNLPHMEIDSIPYEEFPVENHWAYDRIYRYDMIRQPDVLLLLFLYSQDYSPETKRVNYEYYEPRCSHESSRSASIHSILAAELGKHEKAHEYAEFACRLDLDNYYGDTGKGLHVASMAGAWLSVVCGFGGLRADGEILVFNPSLPKNRTSISFTIQYRSSKIAAAINQKNIALKVISGPAIEVQIYGKKYPVDSVGVEVPYG